ncbi:DNA alkylation repair protein [Williamwhitmania taraxaci]|uniref:3-methyladenine DNA glycosylase AlkD n=1 Tax=Williamwhitmania taraxaci TaxID=1640674 RepID=A0A1G6LC93_9BACT|nr:DNA alkylation repair protein [Williamwhitmania taraxaci]SDC40899.1 3-methyladenine DNA glycosylase AlkD [Williamwhitmania taraxaci]
MNSSEKYFILLGDLMRQKNGQVSETMLDMGIMYKVNYGVSIATIRQAAKPFGPDHDLAEMLFQHDSREAKIAASLVEDPTKVTREQMEAWSVDFINSELVEQVCANLFQKVEFALAKSFEWCLADNMYLKMAGYLLAGYSARNLEYRDSQLLSYLDCIEEDASDCEVYLRNSIAFCLREIALRNLNCKEQVFAFLKKFESKGDASSLWIAEEVKMVVG